MSTVTIGVCLYYLEVEIHIFNILLLLLIIFSGTLIQAGVFIIASVPSFWVVRSGGMLELFLYNFKEFIRYLLSIYSGFIQVFLTFILPYAFISFYPAQWFLNKDDIPAFSSLFSVSVTTGGDSAAGACGSLLASGNQTL